MFDEVTGEYSLISRPNQRMPGFKPGELKRPRVANLWKSRDLVEWRNCGVVLKYDELDRHDLQIYGMQPFRYGKGFLALLEVYYAGIERLETQLASSLDGVRWQRTGHREPVLALGGEGTWDSHWVVSTYNPPIPEADRLLIFYSGADTKHASKARHRRAIGLASIRRDGWVSLEAGRTEGVLVTTPLPLGRPMKLELNVNCYSGRISVEVIPAAGGGETDPLPGCEGSASAAEGIDQVSHRVCWGERSVVAPIEAGRCHLRFCLKQASLFSYRWAEAK